MSSMHSDQTPQAAPAEWHAAPAVGPEQPAAAPTTAAPKKNRGRIAAGVAALVIAVGGTTGYLVSHADSSSATASTAQQGALGGAGGPGGGGDLGFQPTQYHVSGTITAVGNDTVTIRTATATTTYTVTSSTHLVDGGTSVSLSSFSVGDSVVASTTTQSGTTLNDMMVGSPGGGPGAGGTAPQGATGTTS